MIKKSKKRKVIYDEDGNRIIRKKIKPLLSEEDKKI